MNPSFTVGRLRDDGLMHCPAGTLGQERLLDGLRKAGLRGGMSALRPATRFSERGSAA